MNLQREEWMAPREEWRPVLGYEGGYEVSNWGRVRSLPRVVHTVVCNLQGLCPTCHKWKTENPADAVAVGFAVPSYAHPELWPGWLVDVGWVQYLDTPVDGSWWRPITDSTASLLMGDA